MTQDEFRDNVQSMTSLVDYQDGSVVSRTLLDKQSGNVTLFAFAENQGLSEHTTPYDALVLIVDGALEITIADVLHRLADGEVLLLPADIPHSVHSRQRSKMLLVMIRE